MDPLEAPLPGLPTQTSENHAWIDDLEDHFFTVPPADPRLQAEPWETEEPDELDEDVVYRASSPWPARLFLGACVGAVAVAALVLLPGSPLQAWFGPASIRYPVDEVITEVDTGPDQASQRRAVRQRRARPAAPAPKASPKPPPMRVDALPALELSSLQPGTAL